jgi:ABC-type branched-subunit amino acid transport system substrate-binding protein
VEKPEPITPVRIGVLYPESGGLASLGPAWADATRLAAEQVNAGGGVYGGRPLELILKDSATDPQAAASGAQELVDEGVIGIVGPATSSEAAAAITIAQDAKVPLISCCATSKSLTDATQPNEGFFFRTTPSDELQGQALAYLAKKGVSGAASADPCPHTAFLYRDDAYGAGFEAVYRAEYEGAAILGGEVGVMLVSEGFAPDAAQAELQSAATSFVSSIDAALSAEIAHPELCIDVK